MEHVSTTMSINTILEVATILVLVATNTTLEVATILVLVATNTVLGVAAILVLVATNTILEVATSTTMSTNTILVAYVAGAKRGGKGRGGEGRGGEREKRESGEKGRDRLLPNPHPHPFCSSSLTPTLSTPATQATYWKPYPGFHRIFFSYRY